MKRFVEVLRLSAMTALLLLAVVAVTGCGDDDKGGSSGSVKTYEPNERLGDSGAVVVDSKKGFDAEQQAVVKTITEFGDATSTKDYQRICDELLSEKAAKIGGGCVKTLKKSGDEFKTFKITVVDVSIGEDGKTATADTITDVNGKSGGVQPISLIKDAQGKWRVTILGE